MLKKTTLEVDLDPVLAAVLSIVSLVATSIIGIVSAVVFPTISSLRKQVEEAKESSFKQLTALEAKYEARLLNLKTEYDNKIIALEAKYEAKLVAYETKIEKLEEELNLCESEREENIRRNVLYEERFKLLERGVEGHVYAEQDEKGSLSIVFVDYGMVEIFGYNMTEFIGAPVEKLIAPVDRPKHLHKIHMHDFSDPDFTGAVNHGVAINKRGEQFPVTVELYVTTYHGKRVQAARIRKV